jgi:hypothetical protein
MKGDPWDNSGEPEVEVDSLRKAEDALLGFSFGSLAGSLTEMSEPPWRLVASETGVNSLDVLFSAVPWPGRERERASSIRFRRSARLFSDACLDL